VSARGTNPQSRRSGVAFGKGQGQELGAGKAMEEGDRSKERRFAGDRIRVSVASLTGNEPGIVGAI